MFRTVRTAALALLLLVGSLTQAETRALSDFSLLYRADVTITGQAVNGEIPATVRVYSRKTGRKLLEVPTRISRDDRPQAVTISGHPYDADYLLDYEDFDFDGVKDLAVQDGQDSCYGLPSYQVYLARRGSFVQNPGLTRLAHDYCGLFRVDRQTKRLNTMTKSGCCWHQFSSFKLVGGQPVLWDQVEETVTVTGIYVSRKVNRKDGKPAHQTTYLMAQGLPGPIYRFPLSGKAGRRVTLWTNDIDLDYALLRAEDSEDVVEFSPLLAAQDRNKDAEAVPRVQFNLDMNAGRLSFRNLDTVYTVIDTPQRLGNELNQGGNITFLAGDRAKQKGSLEALAALKLDNVCLSQCPPLR